MQIITDLGSIHTSAVSRVASYYEQTLATISSHGILNWVMSVGSLIANLSVYFLMS